MSDKDLVQIIAEKFRAEAVARFAEAGANDARGAAFWDVAAWLEEDFAPLLNSHTTSIAVEPCPRRQCRGRVPHTRFNHWLGWVRR